MCVFVVVVLLKEGNFFDGSIWWCAPNTHSLFRELCIYLQCFSAEFVVRSPCKERWWGLSYIIYEYHRTTCSLVAESLSQNLRMFFICFFCSFFMPMTCRSIQFNFCEIFSSVQKACEKMFTCLHERKRQRYGRVTSSYVIWIYIELFM